MYIQDILNHFIIAYSPEKANCDFLLKMRGKYGIIIEPSRKEVSPTEKKGIKIAAQNRKAFHDYFVEDALTEADALAAVGQDEHQEERA